MMNQDDDGSTCEWAPLLNWTEPFLVAPNPATDATLSPEYGAVCIGKGSSGVTQCYLDLHPHSPLVSSLLSTACTLKLLPPECLHIGKDVMLSILCPPRIICHTCKDVGCCCANATQNAAPSTPCHGWPASIVSIMSNASVILKVQSCIQPAHQG